MEEDMVSIAVVVLASRCGSVGSACSGGCGYLVMKRHWSLIEGVRALSTCLNGCKQDWRSLTRRLWL